MTHEVISNKERGRKTHLQQCKMTQAVQNLPGTFFGNFFATSFVIPSGFCPFGEFVASFSVLLELPY